MNTNKKNTTQRTIKPTTRLLIITSAMALSCAGSAKGSIAWASTPSTTYTPGMTNTFTDSAVGSPITVDFSSNIGGTLAVSATGTQINLVTTSLISAGTTLNFCFDLNMQLGSGGAGKRAASQFRLARAPGVGIPV